MGCGSCTAGDTNINEVKGCKNNGGCSSGGCNKMNVFDWLSNMDLPLDTQFDVVEVRFKGGRKDYFRNSHQLELVTGDPVIVDVPNGHHLGHVSMQGELVRLQMRRKKVQNNDDIPSIYRKASLKDLEKYQETKNREMPTLYRTREIVQDLKLEMKLSDIEFQADNAKATFYYSADDRVDFRELIKVLASEFKIRVEMRQISLRQEAGRLGGIGVCGRELCCSTWLSDFKSVNTSAARYQNMSLNPTKLSGQCGRLKCCLNYELDTYMTALKDIPEIDKPIRTKKGSAYLQKTDIFRKLMWFSYAEENSWHAVPVSRVIEILEMNEKEKFPETLLEDKIAKEPVGKSNDILNIDKHKGGSKKKKRRRPNKNRNQKRRPNSDK